VLITEGAFMRESSDYVLSLEVQSGNSWKEVFIHNTNE
jgi:hypothetical protein